MLPPFMLLFASDPRMAEQAFFACDGPGSFPHRGANRRIVRARMHRPAYHGGYHESD